MLKHLLLVFIGFSGKKNYLRFCFHQKKYNPSSTIADVYKNKKSKKLHNFFDVAPKETAFL